VVAGHTSRQEATITLSVLGSLERALRDETWIAQATSSERGFGRKLLTRRDQEIPAPWSPP